VVIAVYVDVVFNTLLVAFVFWFKVSDAKLNPRCKSFFQQSRKDTKDGIYYNNVALGHNFLGSMMKKISEAAKLSRKVITHPSFASFFACEIKNN
jgi:hypothetical protein